MVLSYPDFYKSVKDFPSNDFDWRRSPTDKSLRLTSPLEIDGIIEEGFTFEGRTLIDTPDRNVTFLLCYSSPRGAARGVQIAKAEWKPIKGHNNKGIGPKQFRFVEQKRSHYHDFDVNFALGDVWLRRKLPVATPIDPEPGDFNEFLDFVGRNLNIRNIWLVEEPPWEREWQHDLI